MKGPAVEWTAAQWERVSADGLLTWRASEQGLSRIQLETLCDSISAIARMHLTNTEEIVETARMLPMALAHCDDLQFASVHEAIAYAILHLADRYGRVTQVLESLFARGHLPLRRSRLAILDVGAGPAPGLYAAGDFYDDLQGWIIASEEPVQITGVTDAHALDRGDAWDHVLHVLSEEI